MIAIAIGTTSVRTVEFETGPLAAPTNNSVPVLSGNFVPGGEVSMTRGSWTGSRPITYTFAWQADGVDIVGANARDFTIPDEPEWIGVELTGTAYAENSENPGAPVAAVSLPRTVESVPINSEAPEITGTPKVGETLTVSAGTWSGSPTSYTYTWVRNGANELPQAGVDPEDYVVPSGTQGQSLKVIVTATNSIGTSDPVDSNTVTLELADAAPVNTVAPAISGTPNPGETLTAVPGTWTGSPTPTISGQWLADDVEIVGETGLTYEAIEGDVGKEISYEETADNGIGSPVTAESNTIEIVSAGGVEFPTTASALWGLWETDAGVTVSGGDVTVWEDQSGNGRHLDQATAEDRFTYSATGGKGGGPIFVGDNAKMVWADDSPTKSVPSGPVTVYAVIGNTLVGSAGSATLLNESWSMLVERTDPGSGGLVFANVGDGDVGFIWSLTEAETSSGDFKVISLRKDDDQERVFDGLTAGENAITGSPTDFPVFAGIGAITGNLAAIAVIAGEVTDLEHAAIVSYFSDKYVE